LILVPALFGALPAIAPATLLGTNKASSLCGLVSSVVRYVPSVAVPWRIVAPAMTAGFLASCAGAGTVRIIPAQFLRPVIPFMLAAVLIYTLRHRHLGAEPRARPVHERGVLPGVLLIGALGFYDGFLGPGTGAMMMFALVRFYGLDFLGASASARLLNLATNAGALLVFAVLRELIWPLAIALAAASCGCSSS
jgi:uncharacterized membrane protein YfcA